MEAKIVEYKSKIILLIDLWGAKTEQDILNVQQQGFKLREASSGIAGVLVNHKGVDYVYSEAYINKLKGSIAKYGQEKVALVGMVGINKVLASGVNALAGIINAALFDTEEEAKEWLVN